MTQGFCKITVNLPVDAFWQAISDFVVARSYLSGVIGRTVKGKGFIALRILTLVDGYTIIERLVMLELR